jgi:hypothetical protein
VQTYVFTIIAIGALLYERKSFINFRTVRKAAREVRVFGDDIIVPLDCSDTTQEALGDLGFKVNTAKTFSEGNFRESCGVDAYDGYDVTKVSCLTSPDVTRPESIVSSVDTHNNFFDRGYLCSAEFIKSTVRRQRSMIVPTVAVGSGAFGFFGFDDEIGKGLKKRFNPHLHRSEIFCTCVSNRTERKAVERDSTLLQYFTEVCKPPDRSEERLGVVSRTVTKLRNRWVSESALNSRALPEEGRV